MSMMVLLEQLVSVVVGLEIWLSNCSIENLDDKTQSLGKQFSLSELVWSFINISLLLKSVLVLAPLNLHLSLYLLII